MKVKELIALLEKLPADADVKVTKARLADKKHLSYDVWIQSCSNVRLEEKGEPARVYLE